MDTQRPSGFLLLNVGGNSNNVSDGNAGPGYMNNNNLTNTNTNNGARLNFVSQTSQSN